MDYLYCTKTSTFLLCRNALGMVFRWNISGVLPGISCLVWPLECLAVACPSATAAEATKKASIDWAKAREWWAYQAPQKSGLPAVSNLDWPSQRIDHFILAKLASRQLVPSPKAPRRTLARRLYFDLTGLPPKPLQLKLFVADPTDSRVKREEVIDDLIGSPEFVQHWTNKWADMLMVNSKFLGGEGAKIYREWIRKEVEANTPYDIFVRKILTATGSNKENPPASYFKIHRTPDMLMENTTHLFLATRFNCNKCHDHPFERWTQDQYYEIAAFFSQVKLERDGTVSYTHLTLPTSDLV